MVSIVVHLIAVIGGTLIGFFIIGFLYWLFSSIRNLWAKRKIPKDKSKIGEYIANNPEIFKTGKKDEIDEKEVEENDRREFERTRRFERLRRKAGYVEGGIGDNNKGIKKHIKIEGLGDLQKRPIDDSRISDGKLDKGFGANKQDRQKHKISRPKLE